MDLTGAHKNFEGTNSYFIAAGGMMSFACMEIVTEASVTTYESSMMKIIVRYRNFHTLTIDKEGKFFDVFCEDVDLLQLNCHVLSSQNHNGMLAEQINHYLNKGLCIISNEWRSVQVALEAILLLLYEWNSAPIPGTDLYHSLVAVGRKLSFPIDVLASKHFEPASSPESV